MRQPGTRKAWVDAAVVLGDDPTRLVPCPVCGEANLGVQDVHVEGSDRFERIMQCPNCGARSIMLMIKKKADDLSQGELGVRIMLMIRGFVLELESRICQRHQMVLSTAFNAMNFLPLSAQWRTWPEFLPA